MVPGTTVTLLIMTGSSVEDTDTHGSALLFFQSLDPYPDTGEKSEEICFKCWKFSLRTESLPSGLNIRLGGLGLEKWNF
jgi:hypothetical protein